MKLFNYLLINVKKRTLQSYIKGDTTTAYATYRELTRAGVQESWQVVKPWIREWESKVHLLNKLEEKQEG